MGLRSIGSFSPNVGYNYCMTPRRHFHEAMNNPIHFDITQEELGPTLWFAFTRISGLHNISKLFTYTPPKIKGGQAAAKSEGTEDIPDTKSP